MKKIAALLLALIMALSITGCSQPEKNTETTEPTKEAATVTGEGFRVGFGRASITPQENLPLGGYGTSSTRITQDVLDEIYVDCIAITDENDQTMLLMLADLMRVDETLVQMIRMSIAAKTGIAQDQIIVSCSHTHSVPDLDLDSHEGVSRYKTLLVQRFTQAATAAIADSLPAQLYGGTVQTEKMSFVRHYYSVNADGSHNIFGDNFGTTVVDETTKPMAQAMESMRVLKFSREGGKDVLLASFQAHPHLTGGSSATGLSSDFVGPFREAVEYQLGVHCAFIQGTSGNQNERSRLENQNFSVDKNHREYGYRLAGYLIDCVENNMTQMQTGPVQCRIVTLDAKVDHSEDVKLGEALQVIAFYKQSGSSSATREYAEKFGITSYFHATGIKTRASLPQTQPLELATFSIGNSVGFYVAPGELFSQTGFEMEDASAFDITIAVCLADGGWKYFPYGVCAEYDSYESGNCSFTSDTIVTMMEIWQRELDAMHQNAQ